MLVEPEFGIPVFDYAAFLAAVTDEEQEAIPQSIRNNRYFLESLRLARLAQDTYDYGDYDTSANFAQEAIRYAQLSDEYVALQLKIKEANDAITAAKQRLDWASSSGADRQYPYEYNEAQNYYNTSIAARAEEEWDEAIIAANRVIELLAYITAPDATSDRIYLPAQYTVRTWETFRDCLWNIAGRSWAYGDPFKWRLIYDANRSKMPQPENPDLIEPGMILDIPSIQGETRQGMWNSNQTYTDR
ncbi:MAG: LysM peptidoglycan-binding domain-containing protein [Treponema sp.]|nr:LysM peptidoglycan-binding domain-containing protein [Treponema sp.]